MLKTYLISYDLIYPETSPQYTELIKTIKTATYWAKPLKSVWLVKTNLSSMQIFQQLRRALDNNDKVIVIDVGNDWTSFNLSNDVVEWMKGGL